MDFKEIIQQRRESARLQIRKRTKAAVLSSIRSQLLSINYPLKSLTLSAFQNLQADEIVHYHNQIREALLHQRISDLAQNDYHDLIQDLIYLYDNCDFSLKGHHLPLQKMEDPFTIRFVVYKFDTVGPSDLDYWVSKMTLEDRTILYSHIELKHSQYITPTLVRSIVQDLQETAALELLEMFLEESRCINMLVNTALVYKINEMMVKKHNRPFKFYNVAALICLNRPEQAFSLFLLKRIFFDFAKVTECRPFDFVQLFVLLVSTHSRMSLEDVMVMMCRNIQSFLIQTAVHVTQFNDKGATLKKTNPVSNMALENPDSQESSEEHKQRQQPESEHINVLFVKTCLKGLILTIQNHYNYNKTYFLKSGTKNALVVLWKDPAVRKHLGCNLEKALLLAGVRIQTEYES